ncbi:MAG: hypothetical protein HQK96_00555 [Nitrospirae bacterium]|nr:hypothetical protein [Nitrospirota bacterium]
MPMKLTPVEASLDSCFRRNDKIRCSFVSPCLSFPRKRESRVGFYDKMKLTALAILLIFIMTSAASAAWDNVTASANKNVVAIGESFIYSITVKNGKDVGFPIVNADNLTLVKSTLVTRGIFFNKEYTMQYVMRGFIPGEYVLGGVKVKDKAAGTPKEYSVPDVRIAIQSTLFDNDTLEIAGIKGPQDVGWQGLNWRLIAAALLIAAAAALIYYLVKRRKAKKALPPPPRRAHEVAYEALQRLKEKNLDKAGLIKEFFSELSSIVRHYIEDRFKLKAPEMTTEEFLLMVRDSAELSGTHKELLKDFLNRSDMVKFAQYGPSFDEIRGSFISAQKFVDETRELP